MSQPDTEPLTVTPRDESLLQGLVLREQFHLDQLTADNGSWLARRRQRKSLRQALEALAWSQTRLMGQDAFVIRRGLLTHGVWTALATAFGWFMSRGFNDPQWAIDGAVLAVVAGAIVGVFSGVWEWDHAEGRLRRIVADLRAGSVNAVSS